MRHARPPALDELDDVIVSLRALGGMTERTRGVFYRGSKAFLHFHEDRAGLFADAKIGDDFTRFRVSTGKERAAFLRAVRTFLQARAKGG